ncbi:MAG: phosphomannomutase [Gammaproteobacteria bacterium]|nr:phosphomannomutase [Gammaproteobacteria bacterium]
MKFSIDQMMSQSGVNFGTSGARGLVSAMTDEICYLYTSAFLAYLEQQRLISPGEQVAVAGDLRPSTPRIAAAVIQAISDSGYHPIWCGAIPSPAVALFGIEQNIAAIMVTGSHIPEDRNGIKFNRTDGEILKEDEAGIRSQMVESPPNLFQDNGAFATPPRLPEVNSEALQRYHHRYLSHFPPNLLQDMRIGVYQHSGVARDLLPQILEALGAEVIPLGRSEQFIPVDTEAIRAEDIDLAKEWAQAYSLESIVSTDGDGDRPLVSDEAGNWLRGDIAGILTARYLGADTIVTPVSSNSAVELSALFRQVIRCRIGSPYVIAAMASLKTEHNAVVGYEANGGFLQATPISHLGKILPPLPTRDALMVILAILALSREEQQPVSSLLTQLPQRFTYSDRLKAFPPELSQQRLSALQEGDLAQSGATFTRFFGTELPPVTSLDLTDGLRFTLESGEIVHLRPSGNAPELRCYTEADRPERAEQLNREIMAVMTGWR